MSEQCELNNVYRQAMPGGREKSRAMCRTEPGQRDQSEWARTARAEHNITTTEQSTTEQSRAQQSRVEHNRAEHSRASKAKESIAQFRAE